MLPLDWKSGDRYTFPGDSCLRVWGRSQDARSPFWRWSVRYLDFDFLKLGGKVNYRALLYTSSKNYMYWEWLLAYSWTIVNVRGEKCLLKYYGPERGKFLEMTHGGLFKWYHYSYASFVSLHLSFGTLVRQKLFTYLTHSSPGSLSLSLSVQATPALLLLVFLRTKLSGRDNSHPLSKSPYITFP